MTTDLTQEKTIQITISNPSDTKTSFVDRYKEENPIEFNDEIKDQYTSENMLEIKKQSGDSQKDENLTKIYLELKNIFIIYLRADAGVLPKLSALKDLKKSIMNVIGNSIDNPNTCDNIIRNVIKTVGTKLSSYNDTVTLLDLYQKKLFSENHSCGLIDLLHHPKNEFRKFFKKNISKVDSKLLDLILNRDQVIDELTDDFIKELPSILEKFDVKMDIEIVKTKQFAYDIMQIYGNEKLTNTKQLLEIITIVLNLEAKNQQSTKPTSPVQSECSYENDSNVAEQHTGRELYILIKELSKKFTIALKQNPRVKKGLLAPELLRQEIAFIMYSCSEQYLNDKTMFNQIQDYIIKRLYISTKEPIELYDLNETHSSVIESDAECILDEFLKYEMKSRCIYSYEVYNFIRETLLNDIPEYCRKIEEGLIAKNNEYKQLITSVIVLLDSDKINHTEKLAQIRYLLIR